MRAESQVDAVLAHVTRGAEGEAWCGPLEQVLSIAARLLGTAVAWNDVRVQELLLWALPRNGNFDDDEQKVLIECVTQLLRRLPGFPGAHDQAMVKMLLEVVRWRADEFPAAMACRGRWGASKRILDAMGVTSAFASSEAQLRRSVQAAYDQYNALPAQGRARVAGPTIAAQIVGHDYATLVPPPDDVLAVQAAQSLQLRRMNDLVAYLGEGRPLTARGNLKLADGRALVELLATEDVIDPTIGDRTFHTKSTEQLQHLGRIVAVAEQLGLVKRRKGVLSATQRGRAFGADPLAAVSSLFEAHLECGWSRHADWIDGFLQFAVPAMLLDLYEVREPVSLADAHGAVGQRLRAAFDVAELSSGGYLSAVVGVDVVLRLALMDLADVGLIRFAPPLRHRSVTEDPEHSFLAATDEMVTLTDVGLVTLHPIAATYGSAPLVGVLQGSDADDVLRDVLDLPDDLAVAELDRWLAAASEAQLRALGAALVEAPEAVWPIALPALTAIGERARPAIDEISASHSGRWFAQIWQVQTSSGIAVQGSVTSDADWVALMFSVLVSGGVPAMAEWVGRTGGESVLLSRLDRVWRLADPTTGEVLAALTVAPLSKPASKEARRALFRYRSRHANA